MLLVFVAFEYGLSFSGGPGSLTFAEIMNEVADHVVVPLLVLMLPLAIAVPWVIRSSLRPLRDAAAQIELAQTADRGFRVNASHFPAEATGFAEAVNGLLGRLDETAARQETFAADVAHELRTPLAILALELEKLDGETAARLKRDVTNMSRLVDQLLVLAQLDAQAAARVPMQDVALADVAADIVSHFAPLALDEEKEIALEPGEGVIVSGRPEAISAALRNLVENALRVTPPHKTVTVFVGPGATLRVRDGGPGLSQEALKDYRQRLHRGDHSSKSGAGLGLAIVSRIMDAHGGSLKTDPDHTELVLDFEPAQQK
ncbi:MAG: HAMP domain-containing sensor histidine kinase [Hyphomonadaceae bacterium]